MNFLRTCFIALICTLFSLAQVSAQDNARQFRLYAPDELVASGLLKYLVPRFSLKHGIRIELAESSVGFDAEFRGGPPGVPVFQGLDTLWHFNIPDAGQVAATRFGEWLKSEIGTKTVHAFEKDGTGPFTAELPEARIEEASDLLGDPIIGEKVARKHCARCHVVSSDDRMNAIGSTPSFFALRTIEDWDARFAAFYALNPHPAITQIDGLTEPFDPARPSPIVPLVITTEDLEDLLAYVSGLPPADLGAPIKHQ